MIFDPIRCCQVEASPEEIVRQRWILAMLGPLGYPKGLISIEKSVPKRKRRFDILVYTPGGNGLNPLLLMECKAEDEGIVPEKQVIGYNFTVQAPFFSVIQGEKVRTFWKEGEKTVSISFLPTYAQLVSKLDLLH